MLGGSEEPGWKASRSEAVVLTQRSAAGAGAAVVTIASPPPCAQSVARSQNRAIEPTGEHPQFPTRLGTPKSTPVVQLKPAKGPYLFFCCLLGWACLPANGLQPRIGSFLSFISFKVQDYSQVLRTYLLFFKVRSFSRHF